MPLSRPRADAPEPDTLTRGAESASRIAGTFRRLDAVVASFEAAAAADPVRVEPAMIAGAPVELRFASRALRDRLTPAFAHLATTAASEPRTPALTINLWDSASTGAFAPPRPTAPGKHPPGTLLHFDEPPVRAAYQPGVESLSILDFRSRTAWHWVADAADQPYWDQASPIRQILFWWLASRDCLQVHGGAVGTPSGGVLLVGKAGSGKSTVALATLGSNLLYAGDDYVAVTLDPSPRVYSLYNSGKLEPPHVSRFLPHLLPLLANADKLESEKAIVYVEQHFPRQTTHGFPLQAVLVPQVRPDQREPRVVPASRAGAFAALAPSTIFQLHTARADALTTMSRLVERVPCYGLEIGTDVESIPRVLESFLSSTPTPRL